jgi:YVTN family beta-propeller protein
LARELIRFRRHLRRDDPQVVHAHFGTATSMFTALAALDKPLVITYRGSDLNPAPEPLGARCRAWMGRGLSQLAALRAGHIVCVSGELRKRLWWRRGRVTVLASGVDPRVFFPEPRSTARERIGWPLEERVVLFNASYNPRVHAIAEAAQIARYSPDNNLLCVTSLKSDTVSLIDPAFREQTAIKVGNQPMDMAFHGDELFVPCQGDGSVHVIDIPNKRHKTSFSAGKGCESLAFY